MADAEDLAAADERQLEQLGILLNARQQLGIGEAVVFQARVHVGLAFRIQQAGQCEALDEAADFAGRHGLLLQVDYMYSDAPPFKESLGRASLLRVLDAEDL